MTGLVSMDTAELEALLKEWNHASARSRFFHGSAAA